jgi:purine-binding chemotaxis protein CheW
VREIAGMAANKGTVVPVPSSVRELLGLTGVRGAVVPVFSLAALLGFPSGGGQPRWLLLCGDKRVAVALAFDQLEGHFEVSSTEIYTQEAAPALRYVNETARHGARLRGVISAARLTEAITGLGASALNK